MRRVRASLLATLTLSAALPKPGDERVHLNLWPFGGAAPNGLPVEVVVESFVFVP